MIGVWENNFFDETEHIVIMDACDPKAKYVRIQEDRLREKRIVVLANK